MPINRCLVVLLLLAASSTILSAAEGRDAGLFVELDPWFVEADNLNTGYVVVDPDDDFSIEGEMVTPELSTTATPRVTVGFRWDDGAGLALSYWRFDDDLTDRAASPAGGSLWDSLFNPAWGQIVYQGTATANLDVEADRLDLDYQRRVSSGEKVELAWSAGLRYAAFDRALDVDYDDGFFSELVVRRSEMTGVGVGLALHGSVEVSRRWSVYGETGLSFLSASIESSNFNIFDFAPDDPATDIRRDEDRLVTMFDVAIGAGRQVGRRFEVRIAYRFGHWQNAYDQNDQPDDIGNGFIPNGGADVGWSGLSVGATARF